MQTRLPLTAEPPKQTPSGRRSPRGTATSALVVSAHVGTNADVFPQVLGLHVPTGARIADVTYGKGVFWRKIQEDDYDLLATDIATGVDCRALPYGATTLDAVVFDPPYMEGFFRSGATPPRLARERTTRSATTTPTATSSPKTGARSGTPQCWNSTSTAAGKRGAC